MSIPGAANPLLLATAAAGGYQISRSLRFNSSDSAFLSRTPASAGNRRTFTWSGWIKRSKLGLDGCRLFVAGSGANIFLVRMLTTDVLEIDFYNGTDYGFDTVAVFRDVSAWYHILVSVDTTQATAADRFKVYVNGAQITTLTSFGNVPQNTDLPVNNTVAHAIGNGGGNYYDGYLADIHFIDGQALTPSSFAETNATTGQWVPKAYSGSYGTNGFQLKFADNSAATATTLGKDTSGNGNNWTPNNLSVTAGAGNDSLVDTPTSYGTGNSGGDVRGNLCVVNPLDKNTNISLANGNLDVSLGAVSAWYSARATFGVSSGKWYWEVLCNAVSGANPRAMIGIMTAQASVNSFVGSDSFGWGYYNSGGSKYTGGAGLGYGASYSTNDVIGVAFDADAGSITFYLNGTSQGVAYSGLAANTYFPAIGLYSETSASVTFNFGQRPFAYTAPSGFKALVDTNIPVVIAKPSTVMDVKLYTGNGSTQTISGLGFSPDFVWLKARSAGYSHQLYDQIRGAGKLLNSNSTNAETTVTDNLTAFTSSGFTLGNDAGTNQSSATYVAWTWDAGSSTVTNTQGSITSQVRANASAGFSIVTYTGTGSATTVGHGLGVAPRMVIVKRRNGGGTENWMVYHASITSPSSNPAANRVLLNLTNASNTDSAIWNDTQPTSTVFSVGTSSEVNANTGTYVAYCFAPVAGYSAMGSYVGNGSSSDGPFVYTGFRPRFILAKCSSSALTGNGDWRIHDTTRDTYNVVSKQLYANLSLSESFDSPFDILSNGFKLRQNNYLNVSGETFIYYAIAESPFAYSRAR